MRKEVICNPRYPHTIKIVRVVKQEVKKESADPDREAYDPDDPLAEQDAEPMDEADSTAETVIEEQEIVLYEGKGRSYTDTTTYGDGTVDRNKRKASIPVRYDRWDAGRKPLDGDTVYATVGANTEIGMVRDCEPDNDRSVVYWDFVRV